MLFTLPENAKIVEALTPAADSAGRTGAYVSLKNCALAFVVVHLHQGNAATVALTIEQASAVAGTGSKVITNVVPIWANENTPSGDALVRQTDAVSFTTSAATKDKMVIFQIKPDSLDLANGFDCIVVKTGASNAANITEAMYYLTNLRYSQATPPTAIAD